MFLLARVALSAEIVVVPASEPLVPRVPTVVYVHVSHGGLAAAEPPAVRATGGSVRATTRDTAAGVWPILVTPEAGVETVTLQVTGFGRTQETELEVGVETESDFGLPDRIEGVAQGRPVSFLLSGQPPPLEDLELVVAEGELVAQQTAEGIQLTFTSEASPFPRLVPFTVRDARSERAPLQGTVRLRSRPRIPVEAEPGASLTIQVGSRSYGPFKADSEGFIEARIDQYPGERTAKATLSDDLGNTTQSTIPLSGAEHPVLLATPGRRTHPAALPGAVYLRATHSSGKTMEETPVCRTPALGILDLVPVTPGLYLLPIEGRFRQAQAVVRIDCRLGDVVEPIRLGPQEEAAARLSLQVWPTELSTDFPVAEVRVALEDANGNRLPIDDVVVQADRGETRMRPDGETLIGEYRGESAVDAGRDRIVARYEPAAVRRSVSALGLTWEQIPSSGLAQVKVRARDARGRPVREARVTIGAGSESVDRVTDAEGWAVGELRVPAGSGPLVLSARSDRVSVRELVTRGSARATIVGGHELVAEKKLNLAPGRVAGIEVRLDPPILNTGRNAVAYITVRLEDQAGQPVLDEPLEIAASEGTVGEPLARADGSWVAEYRPDRGDRAREVEITAASRSVRSSARLPLEPRLGRITVGPTVGWITNFGAVSSPALGFDADFRLRLLGGSVMVRVGAMGYGVSGTATTGFGEEASLTGTVVPGLAAVLLRQDRGGFGFWGGAGGILGFHTVRARFGQQVVSEGMRSIGGASLIGGAGYRLGPGDLLSELRWSWIPGSGGELGFTGNLGGLSAGLGYRLVY